MATTFTMNRATGESYEAFGARFASALEMIRIGNDSRGERVYFNDEIDASTKRRVVTLIIELDNSQEQQ